MLVGPYAGRKVSEVKPIIKGELIAAGDALPFLEPESPVVSRSGEECIVAFTEQWYLKYGEEQWQAEVTRHVDTAFNAYHPELLSRFKYTLGWMKEWACSRLFGLGTRIPWDDAWLIESLSDSTVYMAYYTVAHLLHGSTDNLDGKKGSPLGIAAADLTDAHWDYVFFDGAPEPDGAKVPRAALDAMKKSFNYWYPLDLRVSVKDLIGNHVRRRPCDEDEVELLSPSDRP